MLRSWNQFTWNCSVDCMEYVHSTFRPLKVFRITRALCCVADRAVLRSTECPTLVMTHESVDEHIDECCGEYANEFVVSCCLKEMLKQFRNNVAIRARLSSLITVKCAPGREISKRDFELALKTNISSKILPEGYGQNTVENHGYELSKDLSNWALRNKICQSPMNDLLELLSSSAHLKGFPINRTDFLKTANMNTADEGVGFSTLHTSQQNHVSSFMNEGMPSMTPFEKLVLEELRGIKQSCSQLDLTLSEVKGNQQYLQNQLDSYISEQNVRREADTGMLRNSAAILVKLNQTVRKLTGDEPSEVDEEVGFMFPVKTVEEMFILENRLESEYFATSLLSYLKRKKSGKKFEAAFRSLAEDNVYSEFNVDGRCGKRRLLSLKLFDVILYKAYASDVSRNEYDHELRSCIFRSHNRFNRAKCTAHKRLKRLESPVPSTSSEK